MSLTSLSYIKALYGGVTTPSFDAQLAAMQSAAERVVTDFCHRNFEVQTYTEYLSGTGLGIVNLRQRPVLSITSLWVDHNGYFGQGLGQGNGAFDSTTLLVQGVDYALHLDASGVSQTGIVYRISTVWSDSGRTYYPGRLVTDFGPAFGNIKCIYSAGFDPIPDDIQYAVAMICSYMRRVVKMGQNISSEKLGDYGYHIAKVGLNEAPELGATREVLSHYREQAL